MLERLSEQDRAFIKSQVEGGYYTSEIECVRDAVRRLREKIRDQETQKIRALIQEGIDAYERGEYEVYSKDMINRLFEEALAEYDEDAPIAEHVLP